jgi:hypothetical protein
MWDLSEIVVVVSSRTSLIYVAGVGQIRGVLMDGRRS